LALTDPIFSQQRFGLSQALCAKAFSEPAVNLRQPLSRFFFLVLPPRKSGRDVTESE
jgi:hypothetical protein